MLETLDAAAIRRWCAGALAALRRHQGEINELNVYPVPDGDTGTNLVLTLTAAHRAACESDHPIEAGPTEAGQIEGSQIEAGQIEAGETPNSPPHSRVLRRMARGALLGARGNSGVIVSQMLRALADALVGVDLIRGRALAHALRAATTAAYAAVATPVEGTMLTVVNAAATAAERVNSDNLIAVARAAAAAGAAALARTPEQLPALARAGVVDAGGRGLCLLLDALVETISGEPVTDRPLSLNGAADRARDVVSTPAASPSSYEVQFLLDAPAEAVERLRAELSHLGDSLVIAGAGEGDPPTWRVHVHVDDVGAAVEAAVAAGRPYRISVTRLADQPEPTGPLGSQARAAVVVAPGAGLARIFAGEGATVVRENPSTRDLLDAIRATQARQVVVLPNDPDTQLVARAAAQEAAAAGVRVRVVPTRSPVQALAALAVRDETRNFDDDVIAMAEAAGACRYGEICYASRAALTIAGPCRPGSVLALVDGEVHVVGTGLIETARELLDRMLGGGGELVTLLTGAEAPPELADVLRAHLADRWPFVEVQVYDGGQPNYPLLVGVE
ncbi:MAG: Dak phosphatase [Actinobacteria bacterium]|nr:MAG: Dak phosphatase [Actinomycetota bacterium]